MKDILVLGITPAQGLNDASIALQAKYSVDLGESGKRFVLSLHHNESNSFSFVIATKIYQFKATYSDIYSLYHFD